MFPQFKKINNESGIVLFIVLMTAIVIMIITVGILTQSMNEVNYAQQQIDQITADQLAKGAFWNGYSATAMTLPTSGPITPPGSGRTYQVAITNLGITTEPVSNYNATVSYDTFQ